MGVVGTMNIWACQRSEVADGRFHRYLLPECSMDGSAIWAQPGA